MNLVNLVKSFLTTIQLQKLISIQPRTSHFIFILLAASRDLIFTERSSPYAEGLNDILKTHLGRFRMHVPRYNAFPSEGGHCDFGPRNELEFDLLQFLKHNYNRHRISYPG